VEFEIGYEAADELKVGWSIGEGKLGRARKDPDLRWESTSSGCRGGVRGQLVGTLGAGGVGRFDSGT
jgi:hypothetical protein